jgi:hypothetical protein
MSPVRREDAERLRVLLERGFEVLHHDRNSGKVQKAIFTFHGPSNSLMLKPVNTSFLRIFRVELLVSSISVIYRVNCLSLPYVIDI